MSKIFSRIKLTYLFTNRYLSLARLVLIQLLVMLRPGWNKVEIKLYKRCFNVVSTSYSNVVSTLHNVENPTSDFVSFPTSGQRYFNVDRQRSNNVDPTLKCWLGCYAISNSHRFCVSASIRKSIKPLPDYHFNINKTNGNPQRLILLLM